MAVYIGSLIAALFAGAVLLMSSPQQRPAAQCPRDFNAFLERFQSDMVFQRAQVRYPLDDIWQTQNDQGEWDLRHQLLSVEQVKHLPYTLVPTPEEQREDQLQRRIASGPMHSHVVTWSVPASDSFIVDYHFVRQGRCWFLTKMESHSLSERMPIAEESRTPIKPSTQTPVPT